MTTKNDEQLDNFIAELWTTITRILKRTIHKPVDLPEKYDLTSPQMFTLLQLRDSGPMTMGELAEAVAVTHGVATRMVDRLIEKGMVERSRDDGDRRVVIVSVTGLGDRVTTEAMAEAFEFIRHVFKGVSQSDREQYLSLLRKIEAAQEGGQAKA
ncbi:MAG: MarR family winged helix-turn-helix transcriptional regulator [Candidatus Geothermincolia bacterium]